MGTGSAAVRRILLINPVYNKEILGPFAKYITSQLPLSLGFIAGYVEARHPDIEIRILDEQLAQLTDEEYREYLREFSPDIVGFSVLTLVAERAYHIAQFIKDNFPSVCIVMGGVHVTLVPEEPIKKRIADFVVRNEGEETISELIESINGRKTDYGHIAGLSFVKNGKVVNNPERPLIRNLDDLPPFPYHFFSKDIEKYQFGNMLTGRGCPYRCIFCSQRSIAGSVYRTRSPRKVIEEMKTLVYTYNQRWIFFNNDNFIVNKKETIELCELISKERFPSDLKLGMNARGDSVNDEVLTALKKAHFTTILFGLETGSERIMKLIKKGETVKRIEEGVRLAKAHGFITSGQFIIGFPSETNAETWETIKHALRLPLDYTRFNLLVPYPGSEIYEIMKKEELHKEHDWSNYASHSGLTGETIPYVPKGRTARELLFLQWFGNLCFFLRFKQLTHLENLKYAMAGQIILPDPKTLGGFFEFVGFGFSLILFWIISSIGKIRR